MDQDQLAKELKLWFKAKGHLQSKFRNVVWITLRTELYKLGYWKNKDRGADISKLKYKTDRDMWN